MISHLDNSNFDSTIADGTALVDFWAPWCAPCRMIAPELEELDERFSGSLKVCKVNVDEQPELAMKYGVLNIPTLLYFAAGKLDKKFIGFKTAASLIDELRL